MNGEPKPRRDADTQRGTVTAIVGALGLGGYPLLVDQAADAAFTASINRLRGAPGTNQGGKQ